MSCEFKTFAGHFIHIYVLVAGSFCNLTAQNQVPESETQIVLFVCEHGAARSTIASAYFNKLSRARGSNYKSIFRGTDPDTLLTPATAKGLVNDGFDINEYKPLKVNQADLNSASQIITFDCLLPDELKSDRPVKKWDGIPAISKDYVIARDQIKKRVEILIQELTVQKK